MNSRCLPSSARSSESMELPRTSPPLPPLAVWRGRAQIPRRSLRLRPPPQMDSERDRATERRSLFSLSLIHARTLSGNATSAKRSQKNQPSASSAAAWQVFSKVSSVVPFYSQYGLGLSCVQAIVVASERWAIGDGLAGIRMREILPTALSYDRAHLRVYDSGLPESIRLCCRPCLSLNAACHTHSR